MIDLLDLSAAFGLASHAVTLCGIAAVLAALAPPATARSPRWWRHTRRVLDVLAANVRHARNRMP